MPSAKALQTLILARPVLQQVMVMGHMRLLSCLFTALDELDSNLLSCCDILGQLNKPKGAPVQICNLHRHMPHVLSQKA